HPGGEDRQGPGDRRPGAVRLLLLHEVAAGAVLRLGGLPGGRGLHRRQDRALTARAGEPRYPLASTECCGRTRRSTPFFTPAAQARSTGSSPPARPSAVLASMAELLLSAGQHRVHRRVPVGG